MYNKNCARPQRTAARAAEARSAAWSQLGRQGGSALYAPPGASIGRGRGTSRRPPAPARHPMHVCSAETPRRNAHQACALLSKTNASERVRVQQVRVWRSRALPVCGGRRGRRALSMRVRRFLGMGASAPKLFQWPASALTALYMLLKLGRPPKVRSVRYAAVHSFISRFSSFTSASLSASSPRVLTRAIALSRSRCTHTCHELRAGCIPTRSAHAWPGAPHRAVGVLLVLVLAEAQEGARLARRRHGNCCSERRQGLTPRHRRCLPDSSCRSAAVRNHWPADGGGVRGQSRAANRAVERQRRPPR